MATSANRFLSLTPDQKKAVHIELCSRALRIWKEYCAERGPIRYVETVCGTGQVVDTDLPETAIHAVIADVDKDNIASRYQEPIAALQDGDLEFEDDVEFAYYSIYNLFRRYVSGQQNDDWLIVNQALSALGEDADYVTVLESSLNRVGEQDSPSPSGAD